MKTYKELKDSGLIIFEGLVGSQAYGTNTSESDEDYNIVYIAPQEERYGFNSNISETYNFDNNNIQCFELSFVVDLLCKGNPNKLDLLYLPEHCIKYAHPIWRHLVEIRDVFVTKNAKKSYLGYADSQIKKSRGANKMWHMEKEKVERKSPIDFCHVVLNESSAVIGGREHGNNFIKQGTFPLEKWLERVGLSDNEVVVAKLNHSKEGYQLYRQDNPKGLTTKRSNELRTSETPKNSVPIATVLYNADAYSIHCKKWREYQEWKEKRNKTRFIENLETGFTADRKNLMHMWRLLTMAEEIALGKGVNVDRTNIDREYLLDIRKAKVDFEALLKSADNKIKDVKELYKIADLPESVNRKYVEKVLIKMRKEFYGSN